MVIDGQVKYTSTAWNWTVIGYLELYAGGARGYFGPIIL